MATSVAQCLLGMLILGAFSGVGYALGSWVAGSRSTPSPKSQDEPSTPISDAHYAALRAEMAELYSTLEKLTTTVTRISSRHGMRALREKETGSAPPVGTPKAELLRHYGMSGKVGPEFARAQQQLELSQKH